MPRELVFSTSHDDLTVGVEWPVLLDQLRRDAAAGRDPDTRTARGQHALQVSWSRGSGLVQLGPTARTEDGETVAVPGTWLDLDWERCNRLIRYLRAARDQAFGRPE